MSNTKSTVQTANLGLVGLGVMGQNLALNIESRGFTVAVWNRSYDKTDRFMKENHNKKIVGVASPEGFINQIERPRVLILMLTAGGPVDTAIDMFLPYLDEGDIVVDGGNSWFEDTNRRQLYLEAKGIHYLGLGVSGGEEGARFGPSLMPGGTEYAYKTILPVLEKIAAHTDSGPCVTHVGAKGAGHFVKMVHNGIEYADMQLIAEAYHLLRQAGNMDISALSDLFTKWNNGPLASFLIELTGQVLAVTDPQTGNPLVEMIQDIAGQKGTGKWTNQAALSLGVPIPSIAAAVDARILSSMKSQRVVAQNKLLGPKTSSLSPTETRAFQSMVHDGLLAAKIVAYAQGLYLISKASSQFGWDVDLKEVARIWKGGCIIRAKLLDSIMNAYKNNPSLENLMLDDYFSQKLGQTHSALRQLIQFGINHGIPLPAFTASLSYYDSYRTERLPQNLIQAQRDAFGAHTYQRTDEKDGSFYHSDWSVNR